MTEKLRLLHMVGAAKPGGAETFALRLLVALNRRPDVDLLASCAKPGCPLRNMGLVERWI
jgi:hypothetical protein